MPHSLRVRLKNLQRKGELTEKDIDRIFKALSQEPCDEMTESEENTAESNDDTRPYYSNEWTPEDSLYVEQGMLYD